MHLPRWKQFLQLFCFGFIWLTMTEGHAASRINSFVVEVPTYRSLPKSLQEDLATFFDLPSLGVMGLTVGLSAASANTHLDRAIYKALHWEKTDFQAIASTVTFWPLLVAGTGSYIVEQTAPQNEPVLLVLSTLGQRLFRGVVVSLPLVLTGSYLLGGHKPESGSSHWYPLQSGEPSSISLSTYFLSLPSLTLGFMTNNGWLKTAFFGASILVAATDIQHHYPSQTVLGLTEAFLAAWAIHRSPGPTHWSLLPIPVAGGGFAFGLTVHF